MKAVDRHTRRVRTSIENECRFATRFALLGADQVLIPASSFFESDLCCKIVDELCEAYEFGRIYLVGGGAHVLEFIEDKLQQYGTTSVQHHRYSRLKKRL